MLLLSLYITFFILIKIDVTANEMQSPNAKWILPLCTIN